MPNRYHNLFADEEEPQFTADVLCGKYPNHRANNWNYGLEKLLLPLEQLSDEVRHAAVSVMESGKKSDSPPESQAREFIEVYQEHINAKILGFSGCGHFPEKHYADDHGVILANPGLLENEAVRHIQMQKQQGLVGKYAEFMLARIVNGLIMDLNGSVSDIMVELPSKRRILIESKAARLTNNGKCCSTAGNLNQVSRNGVFIKRNQIWTATQEILRRPRDLSYTALIDYEFIGGENLTFGNFVSGHSDIFQEIGKIDDLYEIERRLRTVITIKSIVLLPTWSLYDNWNRFVEKTRPVKWSKKPSSDHKKNSSSVFAQYLEQSQHREIRSHLDSLGIPLYTHTLKGLQKAPMRFESYGFRFIPADEIEYPARKKTKQ